MSIINDKEREEEVGEKEWEDGKERKKKAVQSFFTVCLAPKTEIGRPNPGIELGSPADSLPTELSGNPQNWTRK